MLLIFSPRSTKQVEERNMIGVGRRKRRSMYPLTSDSIRK